MPDDYTLEDDEWNVLERRPSDAHFTPLWNSPVDEATARSTYHSRVSDWYYQDIEFQLVNGYSSHIHQSDPDNPASRKLVIDGWKGVLNNAAKLERDAARS